jgi:hypothetical protein
MVSTHASVSIPVFARRRLERGEDVMKRVASLAAAGIICGTLGLSIAASASPWRPVKSKLPRLAQHGQSIAVEQFVPSHGNIVIVPNKRHH